MIVFHLTVDGIYFEQYGHMKLQKGVLGTLVIVLFSTPDVGAKKTKREEFVHPFRLIEQGRDG